MIPSNVSVSCPMVPGGRVMRVGRVWGAWASAIESGRPLVTSNLFSMYLELSLCSLNPKLRQTPAAPDRRMDAAATGMDGWGEPRPRGSSGWALES